MRANDENVRWVSIIYVLSLFPIVVHCMSVQAPTDGQVTPSSCTKSPEYDTSCHFFCPKGYRLQGWPIVTCLRDGQWSRNTTTFCRGWFIIKTITKKMTMTIWSRCLFCCTVIQCNTWPWVLRRLFNGLFSCFITQTWKDPPLVLPALVTSSATQTWRKTLPR